MRIDLDVGERRVLSAGLSEWSGPARPTDALARALGFSDVRELRHEAERIAGLLESGGDVTPLDGARALAATEIAFASDVFGSGVEWETTTGMSDEETIQTLRKLQVKLVGAYEVADEGIVERR